jgi:hypothetical protein
VAAGPSKRSCSNNKVARDDHCVVAALGPICLEPPHFAREYRVHIGSRDLPKGWLCNNKDGGRMADTVD